MSLGSRAAFFAWRLYRTSALARRALDPMIKKNAEKGLVAHEAFVDEARPSARWAEPRSVKGAPLRVIAGPSLARDRLLALLNHWGARYEVVAPDVRADLLARDHDAILLERPLATEEHPRVALSTVALLGRDVPEVPIEQLAKDGHPAFARVYGDPPLANLRASAVGESLLLDPRVVLPRFAASPWGSVLPDAVDLLLKSKDWRSPLPPLVSARVDDVTGEAGFGWLHALEERGIRPSIGTIHDAWLRAGEKARAELVAASRRGSSVCPHAFEMDRFIWYDAPGGRPFAPEVVRAHREKIEKDVKETGLVLGKTVNAHFDTFGANAVDELRALGFRYHVGEHVADQDWREPPRWRDPLGTPLYAYGDVGGLFGFQASGSLPSSAASASRYDWLRNFVAVDRKTNKPIGDGLDEAGAIRQGVTQILSSLHAGFPAYLLAHEIQLDAIGRERVSGLLDAILREVGARAPGWRAAPFDELPKACEERATLPA